MKESDFSESVVEQAALAWFEALDYAILSGPEIAPGCRQHGFRMVPETLKIALSPRRRANFAESHLLLQCGKFGRKMAAKWHQTGACKALQSPNMAPRWPQDGL